MNGQRHSQQANSCRGRSQIPPLSGQAPNLTRSVVAVRDLEPLGAGNLQAATGLRVHEAALLSPAPFLSASAVALPQLDGRSAGGRAAGDVHALIERADRPVAAVPGPALRARPVTGHNLDRRAIARAGAGVVDAFVGGAEDWTRATILGLDDGRRVEVVTRVNRLGEMNILALSPIKRAALPVGRPAAKQAMSARSQTCSGTK